MSVHSKIPSLYIPGFGMVGEINIPSFWKTAIVVRHPIRPGRWRTRDGREAVVLYRGGTPSYPWTGRIAGSDVRLGWGGFGHADIQRTSGADLIEYLGPLEETGGES